MCLDCVHVFVPLVVTKGYKQNSCRLQAKSLQKGMNKNNGIKNTKVWGYARVSTEDQDLSMQIDALNGYGVDGIFVGVLCKLGGKGLEQVVELDLNEEERAGLDNSINAVKGLVADLQKLEF